MPERERLLPLFRNEKTLVVLDRTKELPSLLRHGMNEVPIEEGGNPSVRRAGNSQRIDLGK